MSEMQSHRAGMALELEPANKRSPDLKNLLQFENTNIKRLASLTTGVSYALDILKPHKNSHTGWIVNSIKICVKSPKIRRKEG